MTHTDPGTYGAKRATWRTTDPRPLLRRIIDQHPRADESVWREEFWREVESDPDHLRAIVEYWLDNNILALTRQRSTRPTAERSEAARPVVEKIRERVSHEVRTAFLMLVMPNGKELGECTGADCKKFGGWCAQLARAVPANKTVAAVLSEKQVASMWKAASKG